MIMLYVAAIIFLILSIVFFTGRGGFLISGYNTASANEKKRYKLSRLTKVMAIGTGIISLLLFSFAIFSEVLPSWGFGVLGFAFLADAIAMLILTNTYAKRKPHEQEDQVSTINAQTKKGLKIFLVISIPVFILFISFILFIGNIGVEINSDTIVLSATNWGNYIVDIEEIDSVIFRENFERGSRTSGIGSFVHFAGNFKNSEFGNYILYSFASCDSHIIIITEGKTVVVNDKTNEATKILYEQIQNALF